MSSVNLEKTKKELILTLLSLAAVVISFVNIFFGIIVIVLLSLHSLNLFYTIYFQESFYKKLKDFLTNLLKKKDVG